MGNRGQKRVETIDELPADKRACSSLEVRPSSSNSSVQTPMNPSNSTIEAHDGDMDTSSSYSGSTRSEGEVEKDSAYGSSDSDGEARHHSLREYQRQRSSGNHGKFKRVLSSLSQELDESGILAALTELCELLSFATDSSLSSLMLDSFSPILVKLARHESSPDIMLFSIRAITYLCDVHSRSAGFLVRHDAVPALCQRLMAIEYLDVAEQCLQALEKISREQPLVCLQSGAIMAVLTYIDFFSTSVQRVALSTVANVCKKLPSECPLPFMEAVPKLCNLLQYEDRQLVETVATCLIKIVERVRLSSDMLDELCKHGLIHQTASLIDLNGRTTVCQSVYTGLIGLLVKLASGSIVAVRTLFELNITSILKDILSTPDLSHGSVSPNMVDGHCNQVYEVLKLLNELFPAIARDLNAPLNSEKEDFLVNQPDFLQNIGMDLLPILIQVVNSGANLYVCYGSLSVINKFVYFSKSEMLIELFKDINISSFLAGVLTRKDEHVLMLALQIADTVLQKLSDIFLNSFVKEGVFFAIDALLTPEKCSQSMFPLFNGIQLSNDSSQKSDARNILRCFCYTFDTGQSLSASETGTCKLEKDSVHTLANKIRANYIAAELLNPDKGLTDILQKLRTLAAALTDLVNASTTRDTCMQPEEEFHSMLHQIMAQVNGGDPISTFEFIESGIVKALVNYLSNAHFLRENTEVTDGFSHTKNVEKRFEVFGRLFLSSLDAPLEDFCLSVLTRKLQTALSSVENFPVILSQSYRQRNSYATVPYGRCMPHPCLRVQFMSGDGETALCDFSKDVLTVDPFSSLDSIEGYLWPKVSKNRVEHVKSAATQVPGGLESLPSELPSDVSSPGGKSPDLMDSDSVPFDMQEMQFSPPQEDKADISHSTLEEGDNLRQTTSETTGSSNVPTDHVQEEETGQCTLSKEDTGMSTGCSECSGNEDASPALLFYLEGQQMDRALSLYQAILQQQINAGDDIFNSAKLWSQVYRVTYRRAEKPRQSYHQDCRHQAHDSSSSDTVGTHWQYTPFFPGMFASELEKSSTVCDVLFLLKSLVGINRYRFHMMTHERMYAFAKGRIDNLDNLDVMTSAAPDNEFVSSKLTEKLEQQMRDPLAVSVGGMPSWCGQLMASYPFLFAFENASGLPPRKKFTVCRNHILESATQMMDLHARQKAMLEVEYDEEVGTGLGPTLEFFTLVIAKALQDGRVFDILLSQAFYKLILGQELTVYDIYSFDPGLGRALLEFQAVVERKRYFESVCGENSTFKLDSCFRNTTIEDLCLDFTLPGYPDYILTPGHDPKLVNMTTLEEYVSLVVDATINTGICRQVEAFKSGFNQVFPIEHLQVFTEEELERLLCGECEFWTSNELLDHIKFDHGYTASSPPIINVCVLNFFALILNLMEPTTDSFIKFQLLEVIREFDREQQRAFLQFVTGAPRLPRGGLASLNPKLTIVRKHCSKWVDADLPSVMTCANYLKLPPYSSKERMKEKLLYAITEGQGSFHLS
ncbi:ubiquitin-protein ligase 4 [Actinidia rufa]|uniref:HECT-type E3 ubiquitin transferase n=1 Tax=Actinidia rufa TaxID=165716 RepID=A0A7J0F4M5_9ERIC|nr:ubiquitin-protein ligase 4 [Actinidia rufa]